MQPPILVWSASGSHDSGYAVDLAGYKHEELKIKIKFKIKFKIKIGVRRREILSTPEFQGGSRSSCQMLGAFTSWG